VVAVGGDLEAPFSLGADAVQLHELLHPGLAHGNTACHQLAPDARPAVGAAGFGMHGLDMHQQRLVAQVAPLRTNGIAPRPAKHAGGA